MRPGRPTWRAAAPLVALLLAPGCAAGPGVSEPIAETVQPLTWVQNGAAFEGDPNEGDGRFAYSVAVSGDTMVVGAPYENKSHGTAYIYQRSGTEWILQDKLDDPSGFVGSLAGFSVAISGDTIVVGAPGGKSNPVSLLGQIYLIARSGGTWTGAGVIKRADLSKYSEYDSFGASVAISGKTFAVGAPRMLDGSGAVWVFEKLDGWGAKLKGTPLSNGVPHDAFGSSVAVSGDTIVVGAPGNGDITGLVGAAYVHAWDGTDWSPQKTLVSVDPVSSDAFGTTVGISGDTIVVGAPLHAVDYVPTGAAYVFERSSAGWSGLTRLVAADREAGDQFGSVAISGRTVVVGAANRQREGAAFGAAYAFVRHGTGFFTQERLLPSGPTTLDYFGFAVSVDQGTAVVGAPQTVHSFQDSSTGAVTTFVLRGSDGDPCQDASTCASQVCVEGVCCDRKCSGACAACSKARGATADGTCTNVAGTAGDPACGQFLCDGTGLDCPATCTSDASCTVGHYCAADGSCKPSVPAGGTCTAAVEQDCKVTGCRICEAGTCLRGVCCTDGCQPDQGSYYTCDAGPRGGGSGASLVLAVLTALAARSRRSGRLARGG